MQEIQPRCAALTMDEARRLQQRRRVLALLGSSAAAGLTGCGGGDGATAAATSTSSSAASAASSSSSSASSSAASSSSSSSVSSNAALWGNTGWDGTPSYTTTATVQSISDFVAINPVTYTLRTANTASGAFETFNVASYLMGRYLITNANWKAYCNANNITSFPLYWSNGGYPAGKENHPVFYISYNQAVAYCNWLKTQMPAYTFFIPSEAEWEWAALGTSAGTSVDSSGYYRSPSQGTYVFPWGASSSISYSGNVLSTRYCCNAVCAAYALNSGMTTLSYFNDTTVTTGTGYSVATDTAVLSQVMQLSSTGGVTGWQYDSSSNLNNADFANSDQYRRLVSTWGGHSTPVGNFEAGKSSLGCYDMSGNAYEWTSSVGIATNGLEAGTSVNIVRGGSWYATSNSGSCIARGEGRAPNGGFHSIGFRVACR